LSTPNNVQTTGRFPNHPVEVKKSKIFWALHARHCGKALNIGWVSPATLTQ